MLIYPNFPWLSFICSQYQRSVAWLPEKSSYYNASVGPCGLTDLWLWLASLAQVRFVCLFPVQRAWPLRQQVPQRPPGLPQRQSQPEAVVDVSDMILLSSSSHFQCRKFLEIMTLVDQASHLFLSFEVKKMYFVLAVLSSSFPMAWCELTGRVWAKL